MKILLIYGVQEAGKSTTCLRLFRALKALNATVNFYERFDWGDFKAVLTFAGAKIAIYSAGDARQHLQDARDFGENNGCDVLITAVRYNIRYTDPISDLENKKDFFWFTLEKGEDDCVRERNETRIAFDLLNKIKEIINL